MNRQSTPVTLPMRSPHRTLYRRPSVCDELELLTDPVTVRGIAAGPGTYTGTARVIHEPEQLVRLQLGDVLVTPSTGQRFDVVLPLLGALVTDNGGLDSHAATASRDHGIPGVVGTRVATALIDDGTLIRVYGDTGDVEVLG